jgi:hypothetical protein
VASVVNGVVTGLTAGQTTIIYTDNYGCTANYNVTVHPTTTPTFTQLGPYCQGSPPDVLPIISNNLIQVIQGTWNPPTISTSAVGTQTYTFTPDQLLTQPTCALGATMVIVVNPLPTAQPSVTTLDACEQSNASFTITGSSGSINYPPYTFNYTIDGGSQSPVISGNTNQAVIPVNTTVPGLFTYEITNVEDANCANILSNVTVLVTIHPSTTPTFTLLDEYCENAITQTLPFSSDNGINGTWIPSIINTSNNTGVPENTTYVFTPTTVNPPNCALTAQLTITVNPNTTPLFDGFGPYCQGQACGLPLDALPTVSTNLINGTWNPPTVNTLAVGPSNYVFTPSAVDQSFPTCATIFNQTIIIDPLPAATITGTTTVCQGDPDPQITFTGVNAAPPYTFVYTMDGGITTNSITTTTSSNTATLSVETLTPGVFDFEIISVSAGSCSDILISNQQVTITINETPVVTLLGDNSTICPGDQVVLSASATAPSDPNGLNGTYTWSPTNSISPQSGTPVNATPSSSTVYSVTYTLNGCPSLPANYLVTVQNAPSVYVTSIIPSNDNNTICAGGAVDLTVGYTGPIVPTNYQWSPGDLTTQTITVSPTATTTYTVAAYSGTCFSTASFTVNVVGDPQFDNTSLPDTAICIGGFFEYELQISGGIGNATYEWYGNTIPSNQNGNLITVSPTPSFTTNYFNSVIDTFFYVNVQYDGIGCDALLSAPGELIVVADPIVTLNPQSEQVLCIGGTATCLVPTVVGGLGVPTYLWTPAITNNNILCPPSDVVGTVNYSVAINQTGNGCGSNPSNSVTVQVVPDPIVTILSLSEVCVGAEVPLSSVVSGGIGIVDTYTWSVSEPIGSPYEVIGGWNSQSEVSEPLTQSVNYQLVIQLTGNGCDASDIAFINVVPDPIVTIDYDAMVCYDTPTELVAQVSGGTGDTTYTWYQIEDFQNLTGPIIPVNNDTLYQEYCNSPINLYLVTAQLTGLGCDLATSSLAYIQGLPWAVAQFDVEPGNLVQSIYDPTFSFINNSENTTDFVWDLGDADCSIDEGYLYQEPTDSCVPCSEDIFNYTYGCPPGIYTVMLIAQNQGMCPDTAYQQITIRDEVTVYVPNTFTPNDDEYNQYFYPVFSSYYKPEYFLFQVFNRWGELIFESKDTEMRQGSPAGTGVGLYFVKGSSWSGYYNNQPCPQGTYTWRLQYRHSDSLQITDTTGHVNLVR